VEELGEDDKSKDCSVDVHGVGSSEEERGSLTRVAMPLSRSEEILQSGQTPQLK